MEGGSMPRVGEAPRWQGAQEGLLTPWLLANGRAVGKGHVSAWCCQQLACAMHTIGAQSASRVMTSFSVLFSKCSWMASWGLCAPALERPNRVPSSSNWPPWDSLGPKEQEPSPKGPRPGSAVPTRSEASGRHGPLGEPWGRALAPLASGRATHVSTTGGPGCPQPLRPSAGNAGGHPRKGDTSATKAQSMAGCPSLSGEKLAGGSGQQIRVQRVTTPRPLRMEHGTESDARPWKSRLPGNRTA